MQDQSSTNYEIDPCLYKVIMENLAHAGWSILKGGTAVAKKDFQTAVGQKEALVYLAPWGPAEPNCVLQGQYYSEGRNILEASSMLIPKIGNVLAAGQLVQQFTKATEHKILQSYAVKLLRSSCMQDCDINVDDGELAGATAPSM